MAAYREVFGQLVEQHEWWMPGVRMGDPDEHAWLPNGHDHLDKWAQKESRQGCRRCRLETAVRKAMQKGT